MEVGRHLLEMGKLYKEIFVFGANEAGRHGKGSALAALRYYGAKYGQGYGLQGNSFGIPTKDSRLGILPLSTINRYVESFLEFARANSDLKFNVVKIGCGLAGYKDEQIAPMFKNKPDNVFLDESWNKFL